MLSYRHSFHAGNHGDVLKHWVLVTMLDYLNQKDKPYWYIDTHAGAGLYSLKSVYSQKIEEHLGGIGQIWSNQSLPESLARYASVINGIDSSKNRYPGSPIIAKSLTRLSEKLRLFELHPADYKKLRDNSGKDRRIKVENEDGLKALKGLLPPPTKRGLVLIDPSYEVKAEYSKVINTLKEGMQRFAIGVYAVWYPLLNQVDNIQFQQRLEKLEGMKWLNLQLRVDNATGAEGMYGSGMFIVNPPW